MNLLRRALAGAVAGAAAGAAGTTALNGVTYLDMAVRGRPTSSAPEDTVEKLSAKTDIPVPGDGDTRQNRVSGLGPLTGLAAGVGVGAAIGVVGGLGIRLGFAVTTAAATIGALAGTNWPMAVLGITDPRTWNTNAWVTDIVPHLAYGTVTAAVLNGLDGHAA